MSRTLLVLVGGTLAVLATATAVCLEIIAVVHIDKPATRAAFTTAASLESVVLVAVGCLAVSRILRPRRAPAIGSRNVALGLEILVCTLAAAASAVALAYLSESRAEDAADGRGASRDAVGEEVLLTGTSVAVALATAWQLVFIILHHVPCRKVRAGPPSETGAEDQRMPGFRVKSVRYSQSSPVSIQALASKESAAPKPTAGTRGQFGVSLSKALRSSSSKARLWATRQRRTKSLDSTLCKSSTDRSFDSWDTSSVDAHNRQAVLEMSTPSLKSRYLETIPASPSTSRSSSPATPWTLEPPRSVRTSRSCSSGSLRLRDDARLTPTSSIHEQHIHPLFRSDSPTPPPAVSPNTVVVAAPNAGQTISRCESIQSLRRMRSGSLPAGRSPLSRQASFEGAKLKKQSDAPPVIEEPSAPDERSMTPPVPEWLLSPGAQASPAGAEQHARADARRDT